MIRRTIALSTAALAMAACGIQGDDQVTTYNQDGLPDALANTTSTTSSTTTTIARPTTTPAPAGTAVPAPTTTVSPVLTFPTDAYYVIGTVGGELQRVTVNLFERTIREVITQLESPPAPIEDANLTSVVTPGMIVDVSLESGTASVALDEDILDRMSTPRGNQAISQIVLTLTSFVTDGQGAIGQIVFTIDGEPIPVFVPSLGSFSDEPVAFDDFVDLIADTPTGAGSTTSTTNESETSEPFEPSSDGPLG